MMRFNDVLVGLDKGEHPIDLSIKKWTSILHGTGVDQGGQNCALCMVHLNCQECVLASCSEEWSPYRMWKTHFDECEFGDPLLCKECYALALDMRDLLMAIKKAEMDKNPEAFLKEE